jgi:hypothetical protein
MDDLQEFLPSFIGPAGQGRSIYRLLSSWVLPPRAISTCGANLAKSAAGTV